MLYIYKFTNKTNGKTYIGQTNNIEKRKRGHKSESFNKKSNGYNLPFHIAIRKYGFENFDFEILEEIDDAFGRDYLNEREIFFISYYKSLVSENGYNLTIGGDGCAKPKKTFSECCACSKLLNEEKVRDIQDMLLNNYQYFEIKKKYPVLSDSFLQNINNGWNFKREDLEYPISKYHSSYSRETQLNIINDIKNNISYSEINKKYGISVGYISAVNSGKKWRQKNETYPLCKKACADGAWSKECKYDIIFTNLTFNEIAKKYNKSYASIKAVSQGQHHRDDRLIYPLKQNSKKNQEIWHTLF